VFSDKARAEHRHLADPWREFGFEGFRCEVFKLQRLVTTRRERGLKARRIYAIFIILISCGVG